MISMARIQRQMKRFVEIASNKNVLGVIISLKGDILSFGDMIGDIMVKYGHDSYTWIFVRHAEILIESIWS